LKMNVIRGVTDEVKIGVGHSGLLESFD
jgi:hypothetical protein